MSAMLLYRDVSPTASQDVAADAYGQADFSMLPILFDESAIFTREQTCEHNGLLLDGEAEYFDLSNAHALWSQELSDAQGFFAQPIVLDMQFEERQSSVGLTFHFDIESNLFATDMHISWYRGTELLARRGFAPNAVAFTTAQVVQNYDRVEVSFFRVNRRFSRLRLQSVLFGIVRAFGSDNFLMRGCEVYQGYDPGHRAQVIDSANFSLIADNAVPFLFARHQSLQLFWGGKLFGTYRLESGQVRRGEGHSRVDIAAVSTLGLLETLSPFHGDLYFGENADVLARAIVGDEVATRLDLSLVDKRIWGWIPWGSRREALTQLCFALGAYCRVEADGSLALLPQAEGITRVVDADRLYRDGVLTHETAAAVELTVHHFSPLAADGLVTLFEGEIEGEHLVVFSAPHFNVIVHNAEVLDESANHVRIQGNGGSCSVRGLAYRHSTSVVRREYPDAGGRERTVEVQNMLLSSCDSDDMKFERLFRAAAADCRYEGDILLVDSPKDMPLVNVGERVVVGGVDGFVSRLQLQFGHRRIRAAVQVVGRAADGVTHDALRGGTHDVLSERTHSEIRYGVNK